MPGKDKGFDTLFLEHQIKGEFFPGFARGSGGLFQAHADVASGARVTDNLVAAGAEIFAQVGQTDFAAARTIQALQHLLGAAVLKLHRQHHDHVRHAGRVEVRFQRQVNALALGFFEQRAGFVVDALVGDMDRDVGLLRNSHDFFPGGLAAKNLVAQMGGVDTAIGGGHL